MRVSEKASALLFCRAKETKFFPLSKDESLALKENKNAN
jgi:hypothetical protein